MLIGREVERDRIAHVLRGARNGRGSALVLRGEAGIGKTALLTHATESASGFRLLHALGVESEAELAFAAVDELVRPVLPLLAELPGAQTKTLKEALALVASDGVDRLSAYAATLALLSAAATDQPLLCVVDDAHLLDRASADALSFAARRIENEAIVLLFAAREPAGAVFSAPGVAELRIAGLNRDEARTLISGGVPALNADGAERVIELAHGNPLALLEFAAGLAAGTGPSDLDAPLPLVAGVEWSFRARVARLSAGAQRALLFVAAGDPAEPAAIRAALEAHNVPEDALLEAERHGLLVAGSTVDFCHPLARSAVYHGAAPADRRAAHAALADTTERPDRRAWHLEAAASGPNEEVAAALDDAARAAGQRGGVAAEARALERAARLTPNDARRARRLFRAAAAAEAAGWLELSEQLLTDAAELTADPALRSDALARRSYLLFDRGEFDQALSLATAAGDGAAPTAAARILTASGAVHALVHRLDITAALEVTERAAALAGHMAPDDLDLCHMLAWTRELSGRTHDALEIALACVERVEPTTVIAVDIGAHLVYAEKYELARELFEKIIAQQREAGATGNLSYALDLLSRLELRTGRLTAAYAASLEALQLTEPLGNDIALASSLAWLALVEAMLGRADDARTHGTRSLEISERRGDRWNAVRARVSLGHFALANGQPAAAEWLAPAARMLADGGVRHPNMFRVDGDLIEALVRAGLRDAAVTHLTRLVADADLTGQKWAAGVSARCRALLADADQVDDAFATALLHQESEESPFELARTRLCYGERLRRLQRRRHAREQLRESLTIFDRMRARPWADRARAELRATGERLGARKPDAEEQLTPQEFQVALAASEGLTNKEIGARLFLSPKTVEFHLTRTYRKLSVRSRAELARLIATQSAAS